MTGILFNNIYSSDLGLKLLSVKVTPPKAIFIKKKIPGRDGTLDLSRISGELNYEDRLFESIYDFQEIDQTQKNKKISMLQNVLHGVNAKIVLDDDPEFYYKGNLEVDYDPINNIFTKVKIRSQVEPYKYRRNKTVITTVVSREAVVTCPNLKKMVVPRIKSNANFTLIYGGESYSIQSGDIMIPEFKFVPGDNLVTVKGNGTITFEYQERGF